MNRAVLMGRLTKDPDVRYSQGDQPVAIARYTLAVDRRQKKQEGQPSADFISCVAFGRAGEFAEKYLHKGMRICISGRIQTGSYTRQDGTKVYTTDVVAEEHEFAESRNVQDSGTNENHTAPSTAKSGSFSSGLEGFMSIPDEIDEELPFN